MKKQMLYGLAALAAGCSTVQVPSAPDPRDPGATTPAASYRSAFEGYAGFQEQGLADWRGLNDEVGRVGGHIGILRR